MQQLTAEEFKQIQIEILDVVAAFCKTHGIHYFLDCGTLLGAIRHKGYIPWDDDIDIGMLRSDFDRFLTIFNAENDRYQVISNELDVACPYPFAQVIDRQTVLYEPDEEHGFKSSVKVDVFVYDNIPADPAACEKEYELCERYRMCNLLQYRMIGTHGFLKDIVKFWGYHILKCFGTGTFARKITALARSHQGENTGYVASIAGHYKGELRHRVPAHVFNAFEQASFEGETYDIPAGYDELLRELYGEYMQLPPEEQRVTHHMFVAYRL